jgi:HPr kinase/phosphorylase
MTLRQSTAVAIEGRALLIEGPAGCGKTSLALALIDRGWALVGDDGVSLAVAGNRLTAAPAPATAGLIEVRGVGIVTLPATSAPVALVLAASESPPRYVETAPASVIEGVSIPTLPFDLAAPAAALRAEYALAIHGLEFPDASPQQEA